MQFTTSTPIPEGTTFTEGALDGNVGKTIRLKMPDESVADAKVVAATVADGYMLLTLEVDDEVMRIVGHETLGPGSVEIPEEGSE